MLIGQKEVYNNYKSIYKTINMVKKSTKGIWVISASSMGTMIEWAWFLHLWKFGRHWYQQKFSFEYLTTFIYALTLPRICGGLTLRARFGKIGRFSGKYIHDFCVGGATMGCDGETIGFMAPVLILILKLTLGHNARWIWRCGCHCRTHAPVTNAVVDFMDTNHCNCGIIYFVDGNFTPETF
jgi:hypothetical protein